MSHKIFNVTLNKDNWIKMEDKNIWTQNLEDPNITDGAMLVPALDDDNTELVNDNNLQIKFDNVNGVGIAKSFGKQPNVDIVVQLVLSSVQN